MRSRTTAILTAVPLLLLAACGGGDSGGDSGDQTLTLWTTQNQPERVAAVKEMTDKFTEETGIRVKHSPIAEDELPGLMTANAASGDLPDIVYFPMEYAAGWSDQGLIDPEVATDMLDELGRDTFSEGAIELATVEDDQVAGIPSDAWGQLLVYRKDLFEKEGLAVPESYDAIMAAAQALNDPASKLYGITAATDPADVFTQQTFEHFALANDCQLVDGDQPALDSSNCVEALEFYEELMNEYSPGGTQTVDTTRATYFAGQAGMILWSPFILDEMAGLRQDALPNCPECKDNPAYLAENSGIVSALSGPSGGPAQYGQVSYMGVGGTTEKTEQVQEFLRFFYEDGYLDWIGIAPEGNIPMRQGTQDDPQKFAEGWRELDMGVDDRAPLAEFYGDDVPEALIQGADEFRRWGFVQGQGRLVSAVYDSLMVPQALNDVIGGTPAQEAAESLQQQVSEEMDRLGS